MSKQSLDDLIEQSEDAIEKGQDLSDFEVDHHSKEKTKAQSSKSKLDEKIKEKKFDKSEKSDEEKIESSEEEKSETESSDVAGEDTDKKTKVKKKKAGKAKIRSKKYQASYALIDPKKKYEISESIELVKKTSMTKFDGNVEIHIRLLGKTGKPEQVRGMLNYPNSTGKKTTVVILDEKIIEEILKSNKGSADIYLATPDLMPQVAKLAKILGPKGKMPNPKAGTITADPAKTKIDLEGGQTEYKTDKYGIIHQIVGKVSGKGEELEENIKVLIDVLPKDKINSINLCATMGPAIKVQK